MPYIGRANAKLYQLIETPADATEPEKKLLQALILYRSAWAGVKQKQSFFDKTVDKDYFETTLLDYLIQFSEQENLGFSAEEIKNYLFQQGLFRAFKSDDDIKKYLKHMKKTDNQAQLDFYFLMQKIPDFIEELYQAADQSEQALIQKRYQIWNLLGDRVYLRAAIPVVLSGREDMMRVQRMQSLRKGSQASWLANNAFSVEEMKYLAEYLRPSELIGLIKARKQQGLKPLPYLPDKNYIRWFINKLEVCGISDDLFAKGYLEVMKAAEQHVLNGGKVSYELQCLFDNNDWFSAMQQYRQTHERPLESLGDLAYELLCTVNAFFQLLLNITAILATILIAAAIEVVLVMALCTFFEPHILMTVWAFSNTIPGGSVIVPMVALAGIGLMIATVAAATGIVSNLSRETPSVSAELSEAVSCLGHRIYLSLAALFNQGMAEVPAPSVEGEGSEIIVGDTQQKGFRNQGST